MNKKNYPTLKVSIYLLFGLIVFGPLLGEKSLAATATPGDFNVSLGNLCEYIGTYQTNASGSKNKCSFLPSLSASYEYYLTSQFALAPQLGATLPKSGRDENVDRMTLFALLNTKYKTSYVNLMAGTGFYFTRISGPGGEAVLNNGSGTDSFPLPKEAVYSRNLIVNLGLSLDFTKEISAELYTYVFNAFTKEDRSYSVGLSASYHFGEIL